jgi:hypothetical protein
MTGRAVMLRFLDGRRPGVFRHDLIKDGLVALFVPAGDCSEESIAHESHFPLRFP